MCAKVDASAAFPAPGLGFTHSSLAADLTVGCMRKTCIAISLPEEEKTSSQLGPGKLGKMAQR